jgi:uncharacterized protein (TIGR02217 family)
VSFHDAQFPTEIGRGSSMGQGFKTLITGLDSGRENRVSLWGQPRCMYDVSYGVRSLQDVAEIRSFHRCRDGAANSFRFRDWLDFTTNPTNPTLTSSAGTRDQPTYPAAGDGSTTVFQMVKKYVSGPQTRTRAITLPVSGTISFWVDGVSQTEGADFTIDYSTGEVTFGSPLGVGEVPEWSGEFDVKVRFGEEADQAIKAVVDGYDLSSIQAIPLIEVVEGEHANIGDFFYGGCIERTFSSNISITQAVAFLYVLSATTTGLSAQLPSPTNLPAGGPWFSIINGGSSSFAVKDDGGTTLVTLGVGEGVIVFLAQGASTKTWYLMGA